MLVLTRRETDQILIPSLGITLQVLSIKGNIVKLGIDAPHDIRIFRGELLEKDSGTAVESSTTFGEPEKNDSEMISPPLHSYIENSRRRDSRKNVAAASIKPLPAFAAEETRDCAKETRDDYKVCV